MRFFWSINDFPELRSMGNHDRRRAIKRWRHSTPVVDMTWVISGALSIAALFSFVFICMGVGGLVIALLGLIVTTTLFQLHMRFLHGSLKRFLEEYPLEKRPRICVACEYDLRGTPGSTCPECGAAIESKVAKQ